MSFKVIFPYLLLLLLSCGGPSGKDDKDIGGNSKQEPDIAKLEVNAQEAKQYIQNMNLDTDL